MICGASGVGKPGTARRLSVRYGVPVVLEGCYLAPELVVEFGAAVVRDQGQRPVTASGAGRRG